MKHVLPEMNNCRKLLVCRLGVIDQCAKQQNSWLLDFAYQHKGKCLLELEELSEAEGCFQKAMDLRIRKGDESLIDSTQRALNFVKRHGGLE